MAKGRQVEPAYHHMHQGQNHKERSWGEDERQEVNQEEKPEQEPEQEIALKNGNSLLLCF